MKLVNQTVKYLSVSLLFIIAILTVFFYFNILKEIKGSVDEGLENYKRQIVANAQTDSTILAQKKFESGFFTVKEITQSEALAAKDRCMDTLLLMQDADDQMPELEPVRMLTTVFDKDGRYYQLQIINSMVEEDDLVSELLWDAILLYTILVISIIIINKMVLKKLWKPFYSLLRQLKSYRLGSSQILPQAHTNTKEFLDLQAAVNILLQENINTFEQQKKFIGNASHELQTPLAIITNKLELLLENSDLQNHQAESIAEVMVMVNRLVKLNKSLLLLTKIENKQFLANEPINVNNLVTQTISDLEDIAAFKEITIDKTEEATIEVEMETSLANIIIANLIRNAIFHNIAGGKVSISISSKQLIVRNTGNVIPLDAEKIFGRFYKADNEQGGSGLGLAIVKAICDLYGFDISYHFSNNEHQFVLIFKN